MWVLRMCWVLLGTLAAGSARLLFEKIPTVTMEPGNSSTAVIPCRVTNQKLNSAAVMFVQWKVQGKVIFLTYDGVENKNARNSTFPSANLLDPSQLTKGIASTVLSRKEAVPENYTCEVAESHREGDTVVELIYGSGMGLQRGLPEQQPQSGGDEFVCSTLENSLRRDGVVSSFNVPERETVLQEASGVVLWTLKEHAEGLSSIEQKIEEILRRLENQ